MCKTYISSSVLHLDLMSSSTGLQGWDRWTCRSAKNQAVKNYSFNIKPEMWHHEQERTTTFKKIN